MSSMRMAPAFLAVLILAASTGSASAEQTFYKDAPTVFAISRESNNPAAAEIREPGCGTPKNAAESANVAVVEFSENGDFVDNGQLKAALDCISQERQKNRTGVVVMVFVHGWRHDSSWEDQNFRDFRAVLMRMALREAEAVGGTFRRVIGIYFGWPGGLLTQFTRRYESAQRIGRSAPIQRALQDIAKTTKEQSANEDVGSPLVLAGHSMGALMLQTAFSALLEAGGFSSLTASPAQTQRCSKVLEHDRVVILPDLVLLLNSATDSQITKKIIQQLKTRQVSKIVDCAGRRFRAPLFISASSENDYATLWGFWAATQGRSRTDGNDDELISHKLARIGGSLCPPIAGLRDFGQSWHCLRQPDIGQRTTSFIVVTRQGCPPHPEAWAFR
jgi:hypothetical protein